MDNEELFAGDRTWSFLKPSAGEGGRDADGKQVAGFALRPLVTNGATAASKFLPSQPPGERRVAVRKQLRSH